MNKSNNNRKIQLFETALSIGLYHRTEMMLQSFGQELTRAIGCSDTTVYELIKSPDGLFSYSILFTYQQPDNTENTDRRKQGVILDEFSEYDLNAFLKTLPRKIDGKNNHFDFIFELPHFGLLVFETASDFDDRDFFDTMTMIAQKLSQSCKVCRRIESTAADMDDAIRISQDLSRRNQELEERISSQSLTIANLTRHKEAIENELPETANSRTNALNPLPNDHKAVLMDSPVVVHVDRDLEDIVPIFLENKRQDIKKMKTALAAGDFDQIRIIGHSMKGAGGGYGFAVITEIGRALEFAGIEQNTEEINSWISELDHYLDTVMIVYE